MTLTIRSATTAALLGGLAVLATPACQYDANERDLQMQIAPPPVGATAAIHLPGLHNVVTYATDIVCGGAPEGREGLQTLADMGIRTVVSVDGAKPDVATAAALGLRYVHLPIGYDTVRPERQQELAQALASLPGPIYMHCHHGKHRSAAALAGAVVSCGMMSVDDALARMQVSGTSPAYEGLWRAVRSAQPLPADVLHVDPAGFASIAEVSGMVATMAEIDAVFDLVKQAAEADWKAPDDHPDLVATKETRRLTTLFASLQHDVESAARPAEYQQMLLRAIDDSARLDEAVRGADKGAAAGFLKTLGSSCKSCHKAHRD